MICSIEGCGRPSYRRGWCKAHYQRAWRYGDPLGGSTAQGEPLRYLRQRVAELLAAPSDECELWPYAKSGGYGVVSLSKHTKVPAHRQALIEATGVEGGVPRHKCRTTACFNPWHLEWGTQAENMADKRRDGTEQTGERNPAAKLTEVDVVEIRRRYAECGVIYADLASAFGVSKSAICAVVRRQSWGHVP